MLTGIGLIVAGNYAGERSGLVKAAGVGAIAYGLAKAFENKSLSGTGSTLGDIKERLTQFKDEAMTTFYLDKIFKKDKVPALTALSDDSDISGLDLSALDHFDELNEQYATEFEANQLRGNEDLSDDDETVSGQPEFAYSFIEQPDFSRM